MDPYKSYTELANKHTRGVDYRISLQHRPESGTTIIAPHGGSIERRTSAIARAIASDDFSLYLFEGLDENGSYDTLHITSHRFDEPQCLELVAQTETVITVHGCGGNRPEVLLGGLHGELKGAIFSALKMAGISCAVEGHRYQGTHPMNICNRGRSNQGVQIEFSDALRGAEQEAIAIAAVRDCILDTVINV